MQHLWLGTLDGFLRNKMEGFMSHLNFLKHDGLQVEMETVGFLEVRTTV